MVDEQQQKTRVDQDAMEDVGEDKENQEIAANSQELLDMVTKQGIVVTSKETGSKVDINSGQEAYFALLAQDMISIADKYKKDVMEVHQLFYQVSCNREKLISLLSGKSGVTKWSTLEDLAIRNEKESLSYKHVLAEKGQ